MDVAKIMEQLNPANRRADKAQFDELQQLMGIRQSNQERGIIADKQAQEIHDLKMGDYLRKQRNSDALFADLINKRGAELEAGKAKKQLTGSMEALDIIKSSVQSGYGDEGMSAYAEETAAKLGELGQESMIPLFKGVISGDENAQKKFNHLYNITERKAIDSGVREKPTSTGMSDFTRKVEMFGDGKTYDEMTPAERQDAYSKSDQAKVASGKDTVVVDGKSRKLTPAEKKIDEGFAKDYLAHTARGGMADVNKNLTQLEGVAANLQAVVDGSSKEDYTGGVKDWLPNSFIAKYNQPAVDMAETVAEVVQQNLRLMLGGQFTEREGQNLIDRAFNMGLDERINLQRVNRLIKQIKVAGERVNSASQYYEKNGTLADWNGTLPTIDSITKDAGLDVDKTFNPATGTFE